MILLIHLIKQCRLNLLNNLNSIMILLIPGVGKTTINDIEKFKFHYDSINS